MLRSLDIVVPVFNEEQGLERFHARLRAVLDGLGVPSRVLYVDDGSTDGTRAVLARLESSDSRVAVLSLSRNFGHQAALTAGLDQSDADAVITMDGDGQHPPRLIPEMLDRFREGYKIVLTQRVGDKQASPVKRLTSGWFYRFVNTIGHTAILPGGADFRLLSRDVVDVLKRMPEYHRFLRGLVAWLGFRPVILPYDAPPRIAGHSKYSFVKMMRLGRDAIFSFSLLPLQLGIFAGFLFLLLAAAEALYVFQFWLSGRERILVPGWSSLMFVILIVGGCLMLLLGFIGVYVGYIFQEVKRRPVYVVETWQSGAGAAGDRPASMGATALERLQIPRAKPTEGEDDGS